MGFADRMDGRGWTVGAAIALSIGGPLFGVVLLNLGALVLVLAGFELDATGPTSIVLSLVFVTLLGFGGFSLLYLRYRDVGWDYVPVEFPDLRDLIWTASGYVLGLVGVMAVAIVASTLLGTPESTNRAAEIAMANPSLYLVLIPASFLVIGPGEELLFRGVVQGRLRESFSAWPAIAIASALFAVIHFTALTGGALDRLQVLFILFVPAVVLGVAYERTENLVVPVLIHGAYDATVFTLQYIVVRFAPDQLENSGAAILWWVALG